MLEKAKELLKKAEEFRSSEVEKIEEFRIKYLSKKGGLVTELFKDFKNVPNEQKKEFGQVLNQLKDKVIDKVNHLKTELKSKDTVKIGLDLSLPGDAQMSGSRHPISIVRNEIIDIFTRLGFVISE